MQAIERSGGVSQQTDLQQPNDIQVKTVKAAKNFEAMMINEMLQPMFDTANAGEGSLFGGGEGEKQFRPMLVNEMAKEMEGAGGLGLETSIYHQMLALQEKK